MRMTLFPTALLAAAAMAAAQAPEQPRRSIIEGGYLAPAERIDPTLLVPPPPAAGSAAEKRDKASAKAAVKLRGGARWTAATRDAQLAMPLLAGDFACAMGATLSPEATPRTMAMLQRALADLAVSTMAAKQKYMRPRPFMVDRQPLCTPEMADVLRRDGSYPSGHSAIGWGTGLILAELMPDRATPIVARGRAFGESRVICHVHWLSDVEEGRVVATATIARLHAVPQFQADMAAARAEMDQLRTAPAAPAAETCSAEAAALAANSETR